MFADFKNFAQAKKLTYGNPTKKDSDRIEQQKDDSRFVLAKFLSSGEPLPIEQPPSNTSTNTINDLRRIFDTMQTASDEFKQFSKKVDPYKSHYQMWADSASKITGEKYTSEWFHSITKQTKSFIDYAKLQYNRPRPYQLGPLVGVEVKRMVSDPLTAAYPSAHAFDACLFSNILSQLHPQNRQQFQNIADQIGLSRVVLGVHYFSDIEAGQKLADYVVQKGFIDVPE